MSLGTSAYLPLPTRCLYRLAAFTDFTDSLPFPTLCLFRHSAFSDTLPFPTRCLSDSLPFPTRCLFRLAAFTDSAFAAFTDSLPFPTLCLPTRCLFRLAAFRLAAFRLAAFTDSLPDTLPSDSLPFPTRCLPTRCLPTPGGPSRFLSLEIPSPVGQGFLGLGTSPDSLSSILRWAIKGFHALVHPSTCLPSSGGPSGC